MTGTTQTWFDGMASAVPTTRYEDAVGGTSSSTRSVLSPNLIVLGSMPKTPLTSSRIKGAGVASPRKTRPVRTTQSEAGADGNSPGMHSIFVEPIDSDSRSGIPRDRSGFVEPYLIREVYAHRLWFYGSHSQISARCQAEERSTPLANPSHT